MTDDKRLTPEAHAAAMWLPNYQEHEDFALALDAFGEALLRRQAETKAASPDSASVLLLARAELDAALTESQGYFSKWQDCEAELAAEKAAHEEYRTKGQQHLADLKLSVDRYLREMAEEKAAHEATRKGLTQAHELLEAAQSDRDAALAELKATKARLDQWRLHFDAVRAKLDALRKELAAEQRNRIAQHGAYVATLAELEALRKPLEGELAEDAELVNAVLQHVPRSTWEAHTVDPFEALSRIYNRAKGEPQAVEPAEPRPIVVGSLWDGPKRTSRVVAVHGEMTVTVKGHADNDAEFAIQWDTGPFRAAHTWLSDPPATPALELPRKVEPAEPRANELCAYCHEPWSSHGARGKADNFACGTFMNLPATPAPEPGRLVTEEEAQRIGREVREDFNAAKAESERIGKELDALARRQVKP